MNLEDSWLVDTRYLGIHKTQNPIVITLLFFHPCPFEENQSLERRQGGYQPWLRCVNKPVLLLFPLSTWRVSGTKHIDFHMWRPSRKVSNISLMKDLMKRTRSVKDHQSLGSIDFPYIRFELLLVALYLHWDKCADNLWLWSSHYLYLGAYR